MKPIYIAAPFGAATHDERLHNTMRAVTIANVAAAIGYEPVVVHLRILAGEWGDDNDPFQRAAGMAATMEVLERVIRRGGEVWALRRDDGTMSAGTAAEVEHALAAGADVVACTWTEWEHRAAREVLPMFRMFRTRLWMASP